MNQDKTTGAGGATAHPRRSCLYMPGSNERALEKGKTLAADVLIFDLEDSVAVDAKAGARDRVCAALAGGGYGARELVVRVNGLDTPWGADDIAAAASAGASAVLLPKVTSAADIIAAGNALEGTGTAARLWAMMETARGILDAPALAGAHGRLDLFAMGLEDFAKELHADNAAPRTAMLYALERVVLVARAFGLGVLDGVYPAFTDDNGFAAACAQGRALGFDGKQLIHPRQVAAANAAFAPSAEDVAEARRLIAAFDAARATGAGVAVLDGKMVEALHVATARTLIAYAEAIAARD
jgi:citrate lyase subunit beta/citryl-CoA lyase